MAALAVTKKPRRKFAEDAASIYDAAKAAMRRLYSSDALMVLPASDEPSAVSVYPVGDDPPPDNILVANHVESI